MKMKRIQPLLGFLCIHLFAQVPNENTTPKATVTSDTATQPVYLPRLDKGLLDQKWFSDIPLQWTKNSVCDFFWAKPGLILNNQNIAVFWERPVLLSGETDEWDNRIADELREFMPEQLVQVISPILPIAPTNPKLKLIGRTVECNVCTNLVFSASMEVQTFDIKLVDASTGELLLAAHHRTVDGWGSKGGGIKRKAKNWSKDFARYLKTTYIN